MSIAFEDLRSQGYSSFEVLRGAIKSATSSLGIFPSVATGIGAIIGIVKLIDKYTVTFKGAKGFLTPTEDKHD